MKPLTKRSKEPDNLFKNYTMRFKAENKSSMAKIRIFKYSSNRKMRFKTLSVSSEVCTMITVSIYKFCRSKRVS